MHSSFPCFMISTNCYFKSVPDRTWFFMFCYVPPLIGLGGLFFEPLPIWLWYNGRFNLPRALIVLSLSSTLVCWRKIYCSSRELDSPNAYSFLVFGVINEFKGFLAPRLYLSYGFGVCSCKYEPDAPYPSMLLDSVIMAFWLSWLICVSLMSPLWNTVCILKCFAG